MVTSEIIFFEVQLKNFFILWKNVSFIPFVIIYVISSTSKVVTNFEYIFCIANILVMKLDQLINIVMRNMFRKYFVDLEDCILNWCPFYRR